MTEKEKRGKKKKSKVDNYINEETEEERYILYM